jgi:hypothetical protein
MFFILFLLFSYFATYLQPPVTKNGPKRRVSRRLGPRYVVFFFLSLFLYFTMYLQPPVTENGPRRRVSRRLSPRYVSLFYFNFFLNLLHIYSHQSPKTGLNDASRVVWPRYVFSIIIYLFYHFTRCLWSPTRKFGPKRRVFRVIWAKVCFFNNNLLLFYSTRCLWSLTSEIGPKRRKKHVVWAKVCLFYYSTRCLWSSTSKIGPKRRKMCHLGQGMFILFYFITFFIDFLIT